MLYFEYVYDSYVHEGVTYDEDLSFYISDNGGYWQQIVQLPQPIAQLQPQIA